MGDEGRSGIEIVSDADYELIAFLNGCFKSLLIDEEELNAFLLKLLWQREDDPPLWAAELIDYKEKRRSSFLGFAGRTVSRPHYYVFTKDEEDAIWAMSVLRRKVPEIIDEDLLPEEELSPSEWEPSNAQLFAAYRRNPHIVARFRTLFPEITWDEPPAE